MDNTTRSVGAADRRAAHRRVGAVTVVSFLALLLLVAARDAAKADPPAAAPTATPTVQPAEPRHAVPADPDPHFDDDHDGFNPRGPGFGGGFHGGGGAPGGGTAPAPSSGGTET